MEKTPKPGVIYALHNGDGIVRYIGQTTQDPKHRLSNHRTQVKKGTQSKIIKWFREVGPKSVQIVELERFDVDTIHLIDQREVEFISFYSKLGYDLVNTQIGGKKKVCNGNL